MSFKSEARRSKVTEKVTGTVTGKRPWRIRLQGPLGNALNDLCHRFLQDFDFDRHLAPFMTRPGSAADPKDLLVWGSAVRTACNTINYADQSERLTARTFAALDTFFELEEKCRPLTAFPAGQRLQGGDLASCRSILNALLAAAEVFPTDKRIPECCMRITDEIMELVGPGKRNILHCGAMGGLESSAILDAVAGLFRLTGKKRYLEFARYIADSGCSQQHNIFDAFEKGMPLQLLANGNARWLTACFKGLCELGKVDSSYTERARVLGNRYMAAFAAEETLITGAAGGGNFDGSLWCRGAFQQTAEHFPCGVLGSTAVTAGCIEFFAALAALGEPVTLGALAEVSCYNALLGAWNREKALFAPFAPVPLTRSVRNDNFGTCHLYDFLCGAEALSLVPSLALTDTENGGILNFYEDMEAHLSRKTLIQVSGFYPASNSAEIRIRSRKPFAISLRLPEYCTGVYYCNSLLEWQKNSLLTIDRPWELDEVLRIDFDPRVRHVAPPDNSPYHALMRGPLVMTADVKGGKSACAMAHSSYNRLPLIDYASAGKPFGSGREFIVWFRKMFPKYIFTPPDGN